MNPFAWRLPGVLFGIGMLPLLFHILCLLFRERTYARFGTVLFAAEFMHLTTSRIATLEPMSVFFILLMTDRMIQYCRMSFYDRTLLETLLVLLRCGIDMGLAIAVKWKERIAWYHITFRPRQGGVNSINMKRIFKIGWKALGDFRKINKLSNCS